VKTKLRAMALVAAGVMGSVGVVHAQPAAPVPPAPEPPAAAPEAPPPAAPPAAAQPAAPAPAPAPAPEPPAAAFGSPQPTPDAPTPEAEAKPNPFRFTWLTWHQEGSTKIFGVGPDYQGTEDEVYSFQFKLSPRYYYYDTPKNQAYVSATLTLDTELTNSDSTNRKREPLFGDLILTTGYSHIITAADKETKLGFGPSLGFILPTSKLSYSQEKYFTTTLAAGTRNSIKLAGKKSDWFPNALVAGSLAYQHLFSRATTPTNAKLNYHRQTSTGADFLSDQLSGKEFATNGLKLSFAYFLTIYRDLSLVNLWEVTVPFKDDFTAGGGTGCDVSIANDPCVVAQSNPDRTHGIPTTTFDIALSYDIFEVAGVTLGYNNTSLQLGEDGTRRSVFTSPDQVFYLDLVAYLDNIGDKAFKAFQKKNPTTGKNRLAQRPRFSSILAR